MASQRKKSIKKVYLILHNIRSVHNVGSIFRTADAVGVSKVFLTGYTPLPLDRFGKPRKDIAKTALGAQASVPWEGVKGVDRLIKKLKKERVQTVALEQHPKALDYKSFKVKDKVAILLGNEVRGTSSQTLSKVDSIIEIPMKGEKESLNVSVACGIALFRLLDG